jgi:hypothetical protein
MSWKYIVSNDSQVSQNLAVLTQYPNVMWLGIGHDTGPVTDSRANDSEQYVTAFWYVTPHILVDCYKLIDAFNFSRKVDRSVSLTVKMEAAGSFRTPVPI